MSRIIRRPVSEHRPTPAAASPSPIRSLTAAAPVGLSAAAPGGVSGGGTSGGNQGDGGWQNEAWAFYNTVPELRYVCQWLANALSRCQIIPSEVNAETGQPTGDCEDLTVVDVVGDIAGGPAGQAQLLSRLATFLTVPGDSWVAILVRSELDANGEPLGPPREEWHVLSRDEVVKKGGGDVEVTLPDGTKHVLNDDTDSISRVHRPHPQNSVQADSPVRACLPVLREILRLGQWVEATAKSRLTGAGLLTIASELQAGAQKAPAAEAVFGTTPADPDTPTLPPTTLPPPTPEGFAPPEDDGANRPMTAQGIMDLLIEVAQATINDPSATGATVPIVLQGPGEFIDKVKLTTFGQEFTEVVIKLRESATRRLALTLDVPAEVLLGTGDMNHWSAWQVEESAIKLHVEPLLVLICDALTRYILRPLLELRGHPDPERFVIWYSTANLALRPNRSADAKEAYAAGVLDESRYLTEIGFDPEEDAPKLPTTDEERFRFAYRMAMKGVPEFTSALAAMAGIDVAAAAPVTPESDADEEEPNDDDRPGGDEVDPIPAQPEGDDEVEPSAASVAAVQSALFASVHRRLELAGKRLRTRSNLAIVEGIPMTQTHCRLDKVSRTRALQVTVDRDDHDRALAAQAGAAPEAFAEVSHRAAAELVAARRPITTLDMNDLARTLCGLRPLRSVR